MFSLLSETYVHMKLHMCKHFQGQCTLEVSHGNKGENCDRALASLNVQSLEISVLNYNTLYKYLIVKDWHQCILTVG